MTREEAINVVRSIYQTDAEREALAILVPELRESEDERIRKELKEAFEVYDIESSWNLIPVKRILAWLEKQEQPNSEDLLEWAKKKFNEVEIAMETGADDPALWGERNAFKQVIDKLNSMKNEQLG